MFCMAVEAGFAKCLQGVASFLQGLYKVLAKDLRRICIGPKDLLKQVVSNS